MELVKKTICGRKLHHKCLAGGPIGALETKYFIADKVFCAAIA